MHRYALFLAVLATPLASHAADDVVLVLNGEVTEAVTYELAFWSADSALPETVEWSPLGMGAGVHSAAPGETALDVRNGMTLERGCYLAGTSMKATRIHFGGSPAIRFSSTDQLWVKRDTGTGWLLVEPGVGLTLSGLTFTAVFPEDHQNASTSAPAVSTAGLVALAALLLAGGGAVVGRRRKVESVV